MTCFEADLRVTSCTFQLFRTSIACFCSTYRCGATGATAGIRPRSADARAEAAERDAASAETRDSRERDQKAGALSRVATWSEARARALAALTADELGEDGEDSDGFRFSAFMHCDLSAST